MGGAPVDGALGEEAPAVGAATGGLAPPPGLPDGWDVLGPVPDETEVRASVVLRRASPLPAAASVGPLLDRETLRREHGARAEDLVVVRAHLETSGLAVSEEDGGRRRLVAVGSARAVEDAFGVELVLARSPDGLVRRVQRGGVTLPSPVAAAVLAVVGLDERPVAAPRLRVATGARGAGEEPAPSAGRPGGTAPGGTPPGAAAGVAVPLSAPEVGSLYQFPAGVTGAGTEVAIVELGGGYAPSDLETYFAGLGLTPPNVTAVGVDGATNAPAGPSGDADTEVALDLEVAGALAPGATYVVYFAPNTDQGFADAVGEAIHAAAALPVAVSISWGGPESSWSPAGVTALESVLEDAAALGVVVTVAAGDQGSSDGVADGLAHVDFPASSPSVLGCGGTRLEGTASAITEEVVWNDQPTDGATGGGVSARFPLPTWQEGVGVPPSVNPGHATGRGVPDVAGNADPDTGYEIVVGGSQVVVGGTSAVAPLWAALVALLAEGRGGPIGFLNPWLYQVAPVDGVCRAITVGSNGAYAAGPGWNCCAGWGSPVGVRLADALARRTGPPGGSTGA